MVTATVYLTSGRDGSQGERATFWIGIVPWWLWVPFLVYWLAVLTTLILEDREPGDTPAQEYVDGGKRFARWRDTHVRVTGQVVGELEALSAARWYERRREDVVTGQYLPAPAEDPASGVLCQVVAQAVEDPWQSSRRAHMVAVGNAQRRVWIQSPYFVPEV